MTFSTTFLVVYSNPNSIRSPALAKSLTYQLACSFNFFCFEDLPPAENCNFCLLFSFQYSSLLVNFQLPASVCSDFFIYRNAILFTRFNKKLCLQSFPFFICLDCFCFVDLPLAEHCNFLRCLLSRFF